MALSDLAACVIGTDISIDMLGVAPRRPDICYTLASAEQLPFAGGLFEQLTVALAFHWFRREEFLSEAARVLNTGGWLVVYNNWWTGRMQENPAFEGWTRGAYHLSIPEPAARPATAC